MQESFWWWQCSNRYIIYLPPSLTSLMFFVDIKHHVYLLTDLLEDVLWWSLFPCIYSHARWELPSATQVFVAASVCDVFQALINSLVCWFCTSALGLILFQIVVFCFAHCWLWRAEQYLKATTLGIQRWPSSTSRMSITPVTAWYIPTQE